MNTGPTLPGWLPSSRSELVDLVIEVVAVWIVGGILSVIDAIGGALLRAGDELLGALSSAGAVLLSPFSIASDVTLGIVEGIDSALVALAGALGPFAPLTIAIAVGLMMILSFLTVRTLIEVIRFI